MAYIELILAQLCIGINIISGKFLADKLNLCLMLEIRFIIGTSILAIIFLSNKKNYPELIKLRELNFRIKLCLFAQGLCGGFLFNYFLVKGLIYSSATYAGAITSLVPFFVTLFSIIFLKEKLHTILLIALFLSMLGMFLLFYNDLDNNISYYGIAFFLLAVLPEVLFTVLGRYTSKLLSPLMIALMANIVNMILFIPGCFNLDFGNELKAIILNGKIFMTLLIYGISGGALFFLLWYKGLSKVKASIAGLFTSLMPVFTILLEVIFLGEETTIYHWIGTLVIVCSLMLISKGEHDA